MGLTVNLMNVRRYSKFILIYHQSKYMRTYASKIFEELWAKFMINAANHTLVCHDDRAQVPIVHNDMLVRDNV